MDVMLFKVWARVAMGRSQDRSQDGMVWQKKDTMQGSRRVGRDLQGRTVAALSKPRLTMAVESVKVTASYHLLTSQSDKDSPHTLRLKRTKT